MSLNIRPCSLRCPLINQISEYQTCISKLQNELSLLVEIRCVVDFEISLVVQKNIQCRRQRSPLLHRAIEANDARWGFKVVGQYQRDRYMFMVTTCRFQSTAQLFLFEPAIFPLSLQFFCFIKFPPFPAHSVNLFTPLLFCMRFSILVTQSLSQCCIAILHRPVVFHILIRLFLQWSPPKASWAKMQLGQVTLMSLFNWAEQSGERRPSSRR